MADSAFIDEFHDPTAAIERVGSELRARLSGRWTARRSAAVEAQVAGMVDAARNERARVLIDLSDVERLDTLGAWVLNRARHDLGQDGVAADFVGARAEHRLLLNEVAYRGLDPPAEVHRSRLADFLADMGRAVVEAGRDVSRGIGFLGELVAALVRAIARPRHFQFRRSCTSSSTSPSAACRSSC